jgi:nucleoid DNA-binding protein
MENRLVGQDELFAHLNERVFVPNIGQPLTFQQIKNIVHGMADVFSEIVLEGKGVRFGRMGTFRCHTTPAGMRWDPSKQKKFKVSKQCKLAFRASKSTRHLFQL